MHLQKELLWFTSDTINSFTHSLSISGKTLNCIVYRPLETDMCLSMCAGGRSSERAHKKNFLLVCSDPLPLSVDSSSRPRLMCYLNPNTQPSYFPHLRTTTPRRRRASQADRDRAIGCTRTVSSSLHAHTAQQASVASMHRVRTTTTTTTVHVRHICTQARLSETPDDTRSFG